MRKLFFALLLVFASPLLAEFQDRDTSIESVQARLTRVEGAAYVHLKETNEGDFVLAEAGIPLEAGDELRLASDGHAEIAVDGESLIDLGPGSRLLVQSLSGASPAFYLETGELLAKILEVSGRNLEFRTPVLVASIRGTDLAVLQEGGGKPGLVGVFDEGKVFVKSLSSENELLVEANQETEVRPGLEPVPPRPLRTLSRIRPRIGLLRERLPAMRGGWEFLPEPERLRRRGRLKEKPIIRLRAPRRKALKTRPSTPRRPSLKPRRDAAPKLRRPPRRPPVRTAPKATRRSRP